MDGTTPRNPNIIKHLPSHALNMHVFLGDSDGIVHDVSPKFWLLQIWQEMGSLMIKHETSRTLGYQFFDQAIS